MDKYETLMHCLGVRLYAFELAVAELAQTTGGAVDELRSRLTAQAFRRYVQDSPEELQELVERALQSDQAAVQALQRRG